MEDWTRYVLLFDMNSTARRGAPEGDFAINPVYALRNGMKKFADMGFNSSCMHPGPREFYEQEIRREVGIVFTAPPAAVEMLFQKLGSAAFLDASGLRTIAERYGCENLRLVRRGGDSA